MVAARDTTPPAVVAYQRGRTGVAAQPKVGSGAWWGSPWWIASYVLIVVAGGALALLLHSLGQSTTGACPGQAVPASQTMPGLNPDALRQAAMYALPTLIVWIVLFILVDRYRPQRLRLLLVVLGWGGCVAVTLAYYVNSWASCQMAVIDDTSGVQAIRVAVFVAPFVEEFCKGSVVFLVAILDRNLFTSRVSGAVLGGLAGAGFAFTENIVYYARAIVYGSYTAGAGDVQEAVHQLVRMRGLYTCFAHPLFTLMTGVGVAFAVSSRSKIVRVVAPITGYLGAALLHMLFNGLTSIMDENSLMRLYLLMALPFVVGVAVRVVMTVVKQGQVVSARLNDYVTMGWLPESYPAAFSRLRRRAWTIVMSLWHGNVADTWRLQRDVTQLAYVREAIDRGVIDQAGLWRERELVDRIRDVAQRRALVDATGLRPYWPWRNRRRSRLFAQRNGPGSAGLPFQSGAIPVEYSAVDPRWGPPA